MHSASDIFRTLSAEEPPKRVATIAHMARECGTKVALTMSMQPNGCALYHMVHAAGAGDVIRPITIDTGVLFPETLQMIEAYQTRFGLSIEAIHPTLSVDAQTRQNGGRLFVQTGEPGMDAHACCKLRKEEPLLQTLRREFDAKLSGLLGKRARTMVDEDPRVRPDFPVFNPLYGWSREDVREYVAQFDLPMHPLLSQGYASIGCTPCTRPVELHEDERAGRWSGSQKTACGVNLADMDDGKSTTTERQQELLAHWAGL